MEHKELFGFFQGSKSEIKEEIKNQIAALEALYTTPQCYSKRPTSQEAGVLREIYTQAKYIYPQSASHNAKIKSQAYSCVLSILKGVAIEENKAKLERLKIEDRQNMPYTAVHVAGGNTAIMGFGLLITAAVVFGLIGLPAGLVVFLPFLIAGILGLIIGGALMTKGRMDNDKIFSATWDANENIKRFIEYLTITPGVEKVLQNANDIYLKSKINYSHPRYTSSSPVVSRFKVFSRSDSPKLRARPGDKSLKVPSESPASPISQFRGSGKKRPRTHSLPSEFYQSKNPTPPNSPPQVPPESSQSRNPLDPS